MTEVLNSSSAYEETQTRIEALEAAILATGATHEQLVLAEDACLQAIGGGESVAIGDSFFDCMNAKFGTNV